MFLYLLAVCNHWPLEGLLWFTVNEGVVLTVLSAMWRVSDSPWYNVLEQLVSCRHPCFSQTTTETASQLGCFLWPCEMVRKHVSSFRNGDCLINKRSDERRKSLVMPYSLFTAIDSDERKIKRTLGVDCPLVLRGEFITFTEVSFFFVYSKCG